MSYPSIARTAALTVSIAFVSGCQSDGPSAPGTPLSSLPPSGAVQAVVQQQPVAKDGNVTFVVRILSNGVGVSAYQGDITFEPGAFALVSMSAPDGVDGDAHVLNSSEFATGRIRFAAFTPTAFVGTNTGDGLEAFRFTVKPAASTALANVVATLGVVGTEDGAAISTDRVLASRGVRDITGQLIK
jgi:hypothetical protein